MYILDNTNLIRELFGDLLLKDRLEKLLLFANNSLLHDFNLLDFLDMCCIHYISPGDASHTNLHDGSVDFHTSNNVFEHIPIQVLKSILDEGNRMVNADGLFVHKIDYSDHFSHSDKNISAINFLKYSDDEWSK